jgi:hypothetical protein
MTDSSTHVDKPNSPEACKPAGDHGSAASKLLADCQKSEPSPAKPEAKPDTKPAEQKTEAKPAEQKTEAKPAEQKTEASNSQAATNAADKAKADAAQAERLLQQRNSKEAQEKPNAALAFLDMVSGGVFHLTDKPKPAVAPASVTAAKPEVAKTPAKPAEQKKTGGIDLLGMAKSGLDLVTNTASAAGDAVVKNVLNPIANGFNSIFEDDKEWKASNVCTPMSTAECQWISDISKKDLSWTKDLSDFELTESDLIQNKGNMGGWGKEREHWSADETTVTAHKVANKIFEKDGTYVLKQNGKETKLEDAGNGKYKLKVDQLDFVYDSNNFKLEASNGSQKVEVEARTPPPLELPKDARQVGVTTIDKKEYKIYKGEGKETYLVENDRVISKVNDDGSYTLALASGHMEVKLAQKADGNYEIERLERWSQGRIRKTIDRGALTTYHYDEAGERREQKVFAHAMTPAEIEKLRHELPPNGMAIVHTGEGANQQWFLLRNHGKDDKGNDKGISEVELHYDPRTKTLDSNGRTRLFRDGQEFRINENNEVLIVGPDGVPRAVDKLLGKEVAERLRQAQELNRRHAGIMVTTNADGGLEVRMGSANEKDDEENKDDDNVTTIKPQTSEAIVVKEQTNETTTLSTTTGAVEMFDADGKRYFQFDEKKGVVAGASGEFKIDSHGLNHAPSGLSMDNVGNVRFADGSMFVDSKGVCYSEGSTSSAKAVEQYKSAEATGKSEIAKASSLMAPARGVICGAFDPATAESLCTAAYGGLSGAISMAMAAGNTEMAGQLMSKQAEASHLIGISSSARKATVQHAHELPGGGTGMSYMMADAARNAAMGMSPNQAFLNMLAKADPTNPTISDRVQSQGNLTMTVAA